MALPVVERVARWTFRALHVVDIDSDDRLVVDYGLRVPVVTDAEGKVITEGRITVWTLVRGMLR